jgi:tRNA threonylcarbamoyladenosine biosynthesis protein TsaE
MIALGYEIGLTLAAGDVLAFDAPLGAGKTTLTKGIGKALAVEEEITSPTFTIISEYEGKVPLFHMDFYRIDDEEELELLGVEEFFYGSGICVVEWSGIAAPLLPHHTRKIKIELKPTGERLVMLEEPK